MNIFKNNKKGFTIIELLISIAIFAIMTGVLLAKYGNFNQSVILTNLAYDVALTVRTAQSYGINVKSSPTVDSDSRFSNDFYKPYGVHFDLNDPYSFIFFNDQSQDNRYTSSDTLEQISKYSIKRGLKISRLCVGGTDMTNCIQTTSLDVTFFRPNPEPKILGVSATSYKYGYIELVSPDGQDTRKVEIGGTGKISITDK